MQNQTQKTPFPTTDAYKRAALWAYEDKKALIKRLPAGSHRANQVMRLLNIYRQMKGIG